MRLICPLCGARDVREFTYRGAALARPSEDSSDAAWDAYLHQRENPAGPHEELWWHSAGCGAWLQVRRDLTTHEILSVRASAGVE